MKSRFKDRNPSRIFSGFAFLLVVLLASLVILQSQSLQSSKFYLQSLGEVGYSLTAEQAGRFIGTKLDAGWHTYQKMDGSFPDKEAKRPYMQYFANLGAQMLIVLYRRLPSIYIPGVDQLESPVNSGNLNPKVLHHLDEWVQLGKEYNIKIFLEDWFNPLRAKARGEWNGFDDWTFHENWANFYKSLTAHYKGETAIAGFIPTEDIVVNDVYPYAETGSPEFNDLWNRVMTKLSKAIHEVDPNRNFVAVPTLDWSGGIYTLGSKAMYPNAWKPLNDSNPHILYRIMWNPKNTIKTDSKYPFDNGLLNGALNWHMETGLPVTIEVVVNWDETAPEGVWVWDSAGLQWLRDFLPALRQKGVGGNIGQYAGDTFAYSTHDSDWTERIWVQVLREFLTSP